MDTAGAPSALIGGGTNLYFTELNRNRPSPAGMDIVSYSINPQVHATDHTSLMENLEAQAATVASARQFIGSLPIAISPVTLKPRFNPHRPGGSQATSATALPASVDVRQPSLLAAGWTAGSLKYLAESGVYSITYYETTGWRGIMETEAGSPLPALFRSRPGAVFSIYHVLADMADFAGGEVVAGRSSAPLAVSGLAMRKQGRMRLLIGNLSPKTQTIHVRGLGAAVRVRHLDATNAEETALSPETFRKMSDDTPRTSRGVLELSLLPYAITTWKRAASANWPVFSMNKMLPAFAASSTGGAGVWATERLVETIRVTIATTLAIRRMLSVTVTSLLLQNGHATSPPAADNDGAAVASAWGLVYSSVSL